MVSGLIKIETKTNFVRCPKIIILSICRKRIKPMLRYVLVLLPFTYAVLKFNYLWYCSIALLPLFVEIPDITLHCNVGSAAAECLVIMVFHKSNNEETVLSTLLFIIIIIIIKFFNKS